MTVTRRTLVAALLLAAVIAGCKKDTTTSPTTTTTTTTTTGATPTVTDSFTSRLPVGGTVAFPFTVVEFGAVSATLSSVTGTGVPTTVQLRLGLGTISDDGSCATSSQALAKASTTAQVTTSMTAGTYCVVVQDVGNLFAPATVQFSVLHP